MDFPINTRQNQLSIEQFLRAAKLLEKHAIENLLVGSQPKQTDPVLGLLGTSNPFSLPFMAKFGEGYQQQLFGGKMRQNASAFPDSVPMYAPNSTGTSRRSSPLSAAPSPNSSRFCSPTEPTTPASSSSFSAASPPTSFADFRGNNTNPSSSSTTPSARNGGGRGANRQSRAAHNELEKNRRANLRGHLEALKAALPPESDSQRDTTLSLLTRARNHIRLAKEAKVELMAKRAALLEENLRLQQQCQQRPSKTVSNVSESDVLLPMPKALFASPSCAELDSFLIDQPKMIKPDRDLLDIQGLAPLLPQLYPYTQPITKVVIVNSPFPSPL